MKEIEKQLYMNIALDFSKISKCAAKKVCCVLVKDNNIISIGVNGSQPKKGNCCDKYKKMHGIWHKKNMKDIWVECDKDEHHKWSLLNETHAEINALGKANKRGMSVEGSIAFITHSCCFNCAKALVTFGIKEIYFAEEYDDFKEVKEFLLDNNIKVERLKKWNQ